MLIVIMMTTNILIFFMKHPMSMGLILMIQTITASLITGMIMKTFWMSYIMIITILSGMLVLFIYMASIASNEKFMNSKKLWIFYISINMILMITSYCMNMQSFISKNNSINMILPFKNNDILFMFKMFMMENMCITLMMILYLFVTMMVVNYLVNTNEGPMRYKYTYYE